MSRFVPGFYRHHTLYDFQMDNCVWMASRESDAAFKGGVLNDATGNGKTVTAIAHMLRQLGPSRAPSLIIVPSHIAAQWVDQIQQFADPKIALRVWDAADEFCDPLPHGGVYVNLQQVRVYATCIM